MIFSCKKVSAVCSPVQWIKTPIWKGTFICNLSCETKLMHGCMKLKPCQKLLWTNLRLLVQPSLMESGAIVTSYILNVKSIYSCKFSKMQSAWSKFIPALTGQNHLSDEPHNLLAFPARIGGFGLNNLHYTNCTLLYRNRKQNKTFRLRSQFLLLVHVALLASSMIDSSFPVPVVLYRVGCNFNMHNSYFQ